MPGHDISNNYFFNPWEVTLW